MFQIKLAPPETVKVVFSPLQMTLFPVMTGSGNEFTLTVIFSIAVQPFASVTFTLNIVVSKGQTITSATLIGLVPLIPQSSQEALSPL